MGLFQKLSFPRQSKQSNLSRDIHLSVETSQSVYTDDCSVDDVDDDCKRNDDNDDTGYHSDSSSDLSMLDPVAREEKLKREESLNDYCKGGYHPTFVGELYGDQNEYKIIRKLGWGHFSTVWLAWDDQSQRHVAIKIVRSSKNYTEAALDEIKICEKINDAGYHPGKKHIVQLLDHFWHKGPNGNHVCMVFEVLGENMLNLLLRYRSFAEKKKEEIANDLKLEDEAKLQGKILNKLLKEKNATNFSDLQIMMEGYGGLPLSLVKQIARQLLLALDYLHKICGVIHTDIKPENVLVEITDVERLVKLLELEKKNVKLAKILQRREADQMSGIKEISNNRDHISRKTSINSTRSNLNLNLNLNSNSPMAKPVPFPTPRKNSIPVRTSRPLTSPVETSSVDNFFRSFSFSQKNSMNRFGSVSSVNSFVKQMPISFAKTESLNGNGNGNSNSDLPVFDNTEIYHEKELEKIEKEKPNGHQHQHQHTHQKHKDENSPQQNCSFQKHFFSSQPIEEETDVGSTTEDESIGSNKNSKNLNSNSSDIFHDAKDKFSPLPALDIGNTHIASISIPSNTPIFRQDLFDTKYPSIDNEIKIKNDKIPTKASSPSPSPSPSSLSESFKSSSPIPIPMPEPIFGRNSNSESAVENSRKSTVSVSDKSVLNEFEDIISVKLADLGNACWYNRHFTTDIQTRQYRAPEVILGGNWGCSTDLWSYACLIFELITGDYLFDPRSSKNYSRDEDHLAQMVELLQEFPPIDFLKDCQRYQDFFDLRGDGVSDASNPLKFKNSASPIASPSTTATNEVIYSDSKFIKKELTSSNGTTILECPEFVGSIGKFQLPTGIHINRPTKPSQSTSSSIKFNAESTLPGYLTNSSVKLNHLADIRLSFKNIQSLKIFPIEEVLVKEYKMPGNITKQVCSFLRNILRFRACDRLDAGSLLESDFLDGMGLKNLEKSEINGWDHESVFEQ